METSWSVSPCFGCIQSPCCHFLPVQKKSFNTKEDLEYALDILNHQYIELGLYDRGYWMIYYNSQCAYYDGASTKCRIHDQDLQPQVCKDYKALHCWYKKAFSSSESTTLIRFDRARLSWLMQACSYDDSGEMIDVPSWDLMLNTLSGIPLQRINPLLEQAPLLLGLKDFDQTKGLVFEYPVPQTQSQWALMNFRMNFHGVSLFQDKNRWLMHLHSPVVEELCQSLYGKVVTDFEDMSILNAEQFGLLYPYPGQAPYKFTRH
ncbi:MAG: hypothetical protein JXR70_19520 [Spirochaetales bacterium]|nr:hypothetical protein [Spirochaetales bacterium]